VVTSNGIARFAPYITGDFEGFAAEHKIKLSTGALAVFKHENGPWRVEGWNIRP
jgi:probable phosphoglycerate mutase